MPWQELLWLVVVVVMVVWEFCIPYGFWQHMLELRALLGMLFSKAVFLFMFSFQLHPACFAAMITCGTVWSKRCCGRLCMSLLFTVQTLQSLSGLVMGSFHVVLPHRQRTCKTQWKVVVASQHVPKWTVIMQVMYGYNISYLCWLSAIVRCRCEKNGYLSFWGCFVNLTKPGSIFST